MRKVTWTDASESQFIGDELADHEGLSTVALDGTNLHRQIVVVPTEALKDYEAPKADPAG